MLDRLLKTIIVGTLLLFLLQAVIGVLCRVLEATLTGAVSTIGHAGSFAGGLTIFILAVCIAIGLLVRLVQFFATRDPRAARERASRERALRQRVRRPTEGVLPLNDRREHHADPDPAVGNDEESD